MRRVRTGVNYKRSAGRDERTRTSTTIFGLCRFFDVVARCGSWFCAATALVVPSATRSRSTLAALTFILQRRFILRLWCLGGLLRGYIYLNIGGIVCNTSISSNAIELRRRVKCTIEERKEILAGDRHLRWAVPLAAACDNKTKEKGDATQTTRGGSAKRTGLLYCTVHFRLRKTFDLRTFRIWVKSPYKRVHA